MKFRILVYMVIPSTFWYLPIRIHMTGVFVTAKYGYRDKNKTMIRKEHRNRRSSISVLFL